MLHPLVTLWRHYHRVSFYDCGSSSGSAAVGPIGVESLPIWARRRRWSTQDEAVNYLRYWNGDGAALSELSLFLSRGHGAVAGPRRSAEDVLHALAARLVSNSVLVVEESLRPGRPARLAPAPSSTASAAVAAASPLSKAPAIVSPQALLPALEDAQIGGAEVRPELEDTMAEIKKSITHVGNAGASVEPAPSKVADIQTALKTAVQGGTDDLGQL